MTNESKAPAEMSDTELVKAVAVEVMDWELTEVHDQNFISGETRTWLMKGDTHWNPLTSWDAWRQVEEKILSIPALYHVYLDQWEDLCDYIESDLRTRCVAALQAIRSSPTQ